MYFIDEYVNLKVPLLKQFDKMYFYVAYWTDWRFNSLFYKQREKPHYRNFNLNVLLIHVHAYKLHSVFLCLPFDG